jgi:hypothetical protein
MLLEERYVRWLRFWLLRAVAKLDRIAPIMHVIFVTVPTEIPASAATSFKLTVGLAGTRSLLFYACDAYLIRLNAGKVVVRDDRFQAAPVCELNRFSYRGYGV